MNSILYILKYYNLKYYIGNNRVGDLYLDTCKLGNHHYMMFDKNQKHKERDAWRDLYHYMTCITKCKYKL